MKASNCVNLKVLRGKKASQLNVPLFLDITRQSRPLLPQIDLRFKLLPAKAGFVLQGISKAKTNYLFKITRATLYVHRMRVRDSKISAHNRGLKSQNAIYHFNRGHQYIHCH